MWIELPRLSGPKPYEGLNWPITLPYETSWRLQPSLSNNAAKTRIETRSTRRDEKAWRSGRDVTGRGAGRGAAAAGSVRPTATTRGRVHDARAVK